MPEFFYKNRKKIDRIISSINSYHILNNKSIKFISEAHGNFCNLLQDITRKSKKNHKHIPISFVSKYLHFHNPIVPIYDSFAKSRINKWIDNEKLINSSKPKNGNDDYFHYLKAILQIKDELIARDSKLKPKPNSRYVEYYALWSSNNKIP